MLGTRWSKRLILWCWPVICSATPVVIFPMHPLVTCYLNPPAGLKPPTQKREPFSCLPDTDGLVERLFWVFFPSATMHMQGPIQNFFPHCLGPKFVPRCVDFFPCQCASRVLFLTTFRGKRHKSLLCWLLSVYPIIHGHLHPVIFFHTLYRLCLSKKDLLSIIVAYLFYYCSDSAVLQVYTVHLFIYLIAQLQCSSYP